MHVTSAENLALNWLANSRIRNTQVGEAAFGSVNQGYNWQERSYPYVYSEITGYAVSMFVNAYRWKREADYLVMAGQAAAFLLGLQVTAEDNPLYGAIPAGLTIPAYQLMTRYYSFDGAMCLQGLLDLQAVQPTAELEQAACLLGDWLIQKMQLQDGTFLALYDAEADSWQHPGDQFFDDGGCLHAKHAIGLLKLSQMTGDQRYAQAAYRVCDWVLGLQNADGSFQASHRLTQVVTHPHCYTIEGLLFAYHVSGDERYHRAAVRGGEWLMNAQNRDGSVNIAYKQNWLRAGRRIAELVKPHKVTDATSQSLRIWLLLHQLNSNQSYLDAAARAGGHLQKMQCTTSDDPDALGGFYFWPDHPIMFTWATQFAAHALYMLEHIHSDVDFKQSIIELF